MIILKNKNDRFKLFIIITFFISLKLFNFTTNVTYFRSQLLIYVAMRHAKIRILGKIILLK